MKRAAFGEPLLSYNLSNAYFLFLSLINPICFFFPGDRLVIADENGFALDINEFGHVV